MNKIWRVTAVVTMDVDVEEPDAAVEYVHDRLEVEGFIIDDMFEPTEVKETGING